jgi:arylsulfatase A-like enzyme
MKPTRTRFLLLAFGLAFLPRLAAAPSRPNVVFILADDLGWSDTTLFGTTNFYKTPNLERLAKRGVVFTRAYAASPLCSPTRASILTGQNPARTGITAPVCHLPEVKLKASVQAKAPANKTTLQCESVTRLDTKYFTLAEALKQAGYATAHFGKWHLGAAPYSPLQQGFDVDLPHYPGPGPAGSYVAPWKFKDFVERMPEEHIEDRMGDEAVAWLEKNKDHPFFLNYWQFSVHAPFDAKESLIRKYRALMNPDDPQHSPTYAAMIESMDDNVGKVLDALERLGLSDNTAIVFFSDNGGNMYNEVDGTTPTSNTPLRGGKATVYEGGTRVPCIISWPEVTKAGTRSDTLIQSPDFYPTFLSLLGIEPQQGQIFDGIDMSGALKGKPPERKAIFTFFPHSPGVPDALPPAVTVTTDQWKLIRLFNEGENGAHAYRLYDLGNDIGETHDLTAARPERVMSLDSLIDKFLTATGAVTPIPNPAYNPNAAAPKTVLREWNARECDSTTKDGHFIVTATGKAPFISFPSGKNSSVVGFRARSDKGGEGRIEWLPSPTAVKQAKSKPFQLKPGEWTEIKATKPAGEANGIVRIYLPDGASPVTFDWLELAPAKGKPVRWDF